jgi:hypothetical protein
MLIGSWHQSEKEIQELLAIRPLNHNQEKVLISSISELSDGTTPLNTTWFRSFHTHHVIVNQIKCFERPLLGFRNKIPKLEKWCIPITPAHVLLLLPIHWNTMFHTPLVTSLDLLLMINFLFVICKLIFAASLLQ